jgi:hypothetical protein
MADSFIYAIPGPEGSAFQRAASEQLRLQQSKLNPLKVGDSFLVAVGRNDELEKITNCVYIAIETTAGWVEGKISVIYANSVPIESVRSLLNRPLSPGINSIQPEEFSALVELMGDMRPSEMQLLEHVKKYIAARGYYFDDETIFNYHICLKTRPLVILAGLSGTGKSKLSQLYAEAIGHTVQNGHYLRLAVRPSWNDDRYLLGYHNTITGDYVSEPALDFLVRAEEDRNNLYFFCLDEMNLAHVEYYFSQFLSAMEEESSADRRIILYGESVARQLATQGRKAGQERVVLVPDNLLFTGTINVDETTQPISDKVIDRANTIELFEVDLENVPKRKAPPEAIRITPPVWQSYKAEESDDRYRSQIVAISKILNEGGLGLGYRVLKEIESYIANSHDLLDPKVAFDLQVKQRILPRVRGTIAIRKMLKNLAAYTKQMGLERSNQRLDEMESRLSRDGYTSFWR